MLIKCNHCYVSKMLKKRKKVKKKLKKKEKEGKKKEGKQLTEQLLMVMCYVRGKYQGSTTEVHFGS